MGQYELYNFLKNNPNKWYTTKDLKDKFDVNRATLTKMIKKVGFYKEIELQHNYDKKLSLHRLFHIRYVGGGNDGKKK